MKLKKMKIFERMKDAKGFTLIELIVAMAIMSILMTMYLSLFFTGENTYEIVYDNYKTQNEARIAMSFITVKIRQNDRLITDPADPAAERNAVTVVETPIGEKYLQVGDTAAEYIYAHNTATGCSLLSTESSSDLFTGNGRVIAEGFHSVTMEYPTAADTDKIRVTIEYNDSGSDKIEETIVLRAQP